MDALELPQYSGTARRPRGRVIPFALVLALCGLVTALVLVVMTKGNLAYRHD